MHYSKSPANQGKIQESFRNNCVKMDSAVAVKMIRNGKPQFNFLVPIVKEISYHLSQQDWFASITHIFREGNHAADHLANMGHHVDFNIHEIDSIPNPLALIIKDDITGCCMPRLVAL